MSDLISRSELTEAIKRQYCTGCDNYNGSRCRACHADDMLSLVDDTADAMPHWISVEERLPDAKLQVLVLAYDSMYCKGEIKRCLSVHVGYTRGEDEGWFDWHAQSWLDAAYWLPMDVLPEPPMEE